jgi:hypothetical protein
MTRKNSPARFSNVLSARLPFENRVGGRFVAKPARARQRIGDRSFYFELSVRRRLIERRVLSPLRRRAKTKGEAAVDPGTTLTESIPSDLRA